MSEKSKSIMKKLLKGLLSAATHWVTRISIPTAIFGMLIGFSFGGVDLGYTADKVTRIIYYFTAFGIVSTALTFFKSSTPKYSVRKAIAEIFLLFVNASYFYTYIFSGAFNFENIEIFTSASLSITFMLNFDVMIYVSMATIGLNIFVGVYDLVIALFSPIDDGKSPKKGKEIGYVYAFDENAANQNNKKSSQDQEKDKDPREAYSF